jgi:hypothetical protein
MLNCEGQHPGSTITTEREFHSGPADIGTAPSITMSALPPKAVIGHLAGLVGRTLRGDVRLSG